MNSEVGGRGGGKGSLKTDGAVVEGWGAGVKDDNSDVCVGGFDYDVYVQVKGDVLEYDLHGTPVVIQEYNRNHLRMERTSSPYRKIHIFDHHTLSINHIHFSAFGKRSAQRVMKNVLEQ